MEIKFNSIFLYLTNHNTVIELACSGSKYKGTFILSIFTSIFINILNIFCLIITKVVIRITTHVEIIHTKIISFFPDLKEHQERKSFKGILNILGHCFTKTFAYIKRSTYLIDKLTYACIISMSRVCNISL